MKALRQVGEGTCSGEYGTFIDLFSQGMALTIGITSEVKFFELKVEELMAGTPHGGALKIELLKELLNEVSEGWMDESQSTDDEVSDSSE